MLGWRGIKGGDGWDEEMVRRVVIQGTCVYGWDWNDDGKMFWCMILLLLLTMCIGNKGMSLFINCRYAKDL